MKNIEEKFKYYLVEKGYSLKTPSGKPSTVYDYIKRINRVCKWENINLDELAKNIHNVISMYDIGGEKEDFGHKSHNAVICALKRFSEFLVTQ